MSYPLPPEVRVTLQEPAATDLNRLGQLTGQTSGEVAAVLLAGELLGNSAEEALCAAAVALRRLHIQRRQTLGIEAPPALAPTLQPPATPTEGKRIRIPLSATLDEQLYTQAKATGLKPTMATQILLQTVNLKALASAIGLAANQISTTR